MNKAAKDNTVINQFFNMYKSSLRQPLRYRLFSLSLRLYSDYGSTPINRSNMNCRQRPIKKGHFPCRSSEHKRSLEQENHWSLRRHPEKVPRSSYSKASSKGISGAYVVTFSKFPRVLTPTYNCGRSPSPSTTSTVLHLLANGAFRVASSQPVFPTRSLRAETMKNRDAVISLVFNSTKNEKLAFWFHWVWFCSFFSYFVLFCFLFLQILKCKQ